MSPPFDAEETVTTVGVFEGIAMLSSESLKLPEYEKLEGPLPSLPSVTIYVTVITVLFSNFLPKMPSPNKSSYFSSLTSCKR